MELTSDQSRQLRQFRKACLAAANGHGGAGGARSCHDLVWHPLFKDLWKVSK